MNTIIIYNLHDTEITQNDILGNPITIRSYLSSHQFPDFQVEKLKYFRNIVMCQEACTTKSSGLETVKASQMDFKHFHT